VNAQQLQSLVVQGESELLEFKASTGQLREAMKTVCAMRNGFGGHVLIGVRDGGEIAGQDVSTRTMEDVANELRKIEPPIQVAVERVTLDNGRQVIAFNVPSSGDRGPYSYDGRCYSRIGPTTSVMTDHQRDQMVAERLHGTHRWENAPAPERVTIDDLDIFELQATIDKALQLQRLTHVPNRNPEDLLRGLGLLVDGRLINAAVALFGEDRRLYPFYTQLEVRLARFRGTDRLAPFADNRAYWGHAFELQRRAEQFLADHVPIAGTVHPNRFIREDRPLYAPRATREAIANAICHRDYTMGGGAVTVAMYDDHLEIGSPGGLRFGITPETLQRRHESKPWNPIIANVFYLAGIIERWGAGTVNIIDWCREIHAPSPTWEDQGNSVIISFLPAASIEEQRTRVELGVESRVESRVESVADRVLLLLAGGPLSKSDIATRLGKQRVTGQVHRVVENLLRSGYIEYTIPEKPQSRLQQYRITEQGRAAMESASTAGDVS
jgi:ATP-dependent DNA helicase RecG